ncbi:predicted protein [Histoplasma capsulatum G186AR]|uniref:Uncharacterized protein n=1 Tax=Ajellomyces capsulatus (strain G186AR / H82 / ATCC MYA-2454 / RMSCC 2432) TaxID=447093 RepID=C0NC28_AJECG|nr:uncharacterized protein HCBG_00674 [Histoplasma capsulatum G186AR]EEH11219.1 predicted protein [Histoplasma capsulatum G186AR]
MARYWAIALLLWITTTSPIRSLAPLLSPWDSTKYLSFFDNPSLLVLELFLWDWAFLSFGVPHICLNLSLGRSWINLYPLQKARKSPLAAARELFSITRDFLPSLRRYVVHISRLAYGVLFSVRDLVQVSSAGSAGSAGVGTPKGKQKG